MGALDRKALEISSQACVDESAIIGSGTRIWQFASVIRGAFVGQQCSVGSCSVLDGCKVGNRCSIGHGAQLHPGIHIGDDVFVGPGAIFCNDMWPSVSKDGFEYWALVSKPTTVVRDGASIGAGAIILPGVTVGRKALVAAGAVCDVDVPDGWVFYRDRHMAPMPDGHFRKRMRWATR